MARLAPTAHPVPAWPVGGDRAALDAFLAAETKLLDDLRAKEDPATGLGAVLRWNVADGYAWYVVTSVKPLTLQHIPIGDEYRVDPALIRGLRIQDVKAMAARERRMAELFARPAFEGKLVN